MDALTSLYSAAETCRSAGTARRSAVSDYPRWVEAALVEDGEFSGALERSREQLFASLWQAGVQRVALLDLTTPALANRGHRSIAWDAAAMPAGSHYYPIFLRLIEQFEREGRISPERSVLVETTTGTAGIALGWIAAKLGYRIILFMPEDMPARRLAAVEAQLPPGSEFHLTPASAYVGGMVRQFQRFMARSRHVPHEGELFALDHSRRPEAVDALAEIIRLAVAQCSVPIDIAVAALGNGTASSALFRAVRGRFPDVRRIGVEPLEAPIVYLRKYGPKRFEEMFRIPPRIGPHALIGTAAWGVNFPNLIVEEIDNVVPVAEAVWRQYQSNARSRGVDLGNSSAACQTASDTIMGDSPRQLTTFSLRYDTSVFY